MPHERDPFTGSGMKADIFQHRYIRYIGKCDLIESNFSVHPGKIHRAGSIGLVGVSIQGYGCSLAVGLGIPIPILNEEIAGYTAVSDEDLFTQIIDYGNDYPKGISNSLGQVSYAKLKSGSIQLKGKEIPTVPLSSLVRARKIAEILKKKISQAKFTLGEPQFTLPS